tara:strand:+ start:34 stop:414 length:381 start_codon:yes stop_codon:yes gene_type:complete
VDLGSECVEMKIQSHTSLEIKESAPEVENKQPVGRGWGGSLLIVVFAVIGSFHAMIMIGIEAYRAYNAREALTQLEVEINALEYELNGLKVILEHGNDPLYHEQLARNLGYIFSDEKRVITYPEDR